VKIPDILAHPDDFRNNMDQWAAGFGGVGLVMLTVAVVPVGIVLAMAVTSGWVETARRRGRVSNGFGHYE